MRRFISGVLGLSLGVGLLPLSFAEEQRSGRYLEEVVVTGTKRETGQQDTPLAVSTLTSQDISNTFVNDIRSVAELAPNVLLTKQPGFNALSGGIRGTGSTSILVLQDTSVGITIDDFVISSVQSQFVEVFDLEQVEVYRGPQGTLFGKNSTGGVIAITSKRPDLDEFGGDFEVTFGQYDTVGGNTDLAKLAAAVDLPLIEGRLGLRIAGVYDTTEGYMKNSKDTATFPNQVPWFDIQGVGGAPLPESVSGPARGNGDAIDGKNVLAWKTKLLWQPTDRYEAYFTWEYLRDSSDSVPNVHESPQGEGFLVPIFGFPAIADTGTHPYKTGATFTYGNEHTVDSDGFYLTQTLDLDQVELKLIAGWRETEETLGSNYVGEAFPLFDATRNLEREQSQLEFRAVTNFDGPLNFVAGAAYFTDDTSFRSASSQGFSAFFLSPHPDTGTLLDPDGVINFDTDWITDPQTGTRDQQRDTYALYLDGTFDLNERFSLTAGVRYTKDKKDFQGLGGGGGPCNQYTRPIDAVLVDPNLPFDPVTNCAADIQSHRLSRAGITLQQWDPRTNPLPPEQYTLNVDTSEKWDELNWRFVVDYSVAEDQLLYASIATGYISGGFTETCSTVITCVPYNAETNINYEIGYKADFLDRTLRVNTSVFFTSFDDLQRNQVVPFINSAGTPAQETLTVNAGKSEVYGVEVEATWLATERLTLKGSLGILEAEYKEFEFDPQPNNPATGIVDFSGLDIPFASPVQINLDVTYEHPLAGGGLLVFNANANYQDEAETSPFDTLAAGGGSFLAPRPSVVVRQPTNTQIEDRTLVNASITFRDAMDRYYVTAYGRNLTNEIKRVGANSVAFLWNFTVYGPPREYGLRVGVNF